MKSKQIIERALERTALGERGLRIITPSAELSKSHINKSKHDLIVMNDLKRLNHSDWVVIVGYYSMYHSATALLSRIGLESKDHSTTVAVLNYFFGKRIEKSLLEKFDKLKIEKDKISAINLENKFTKELWGMKILRERAQYGVNIVFSEANKAIKDAREFNNRIRQILSEIKTGLVEAFQKELDEIRMSLTKRSS